MRYGLYAFLVWVLSACSNFLEQDRSSQTSPQSVSPKPNILAEDFPPRLSDWGQIAVGGDRLILGEGVVPYRLNTSLFSDYALKLRTVWVPENAGLVQYNPRAVFDFPVGTVITKTFYYPRAGTQFDQVSANGTSWNHFERQFLDMNAVRLIETRVLVRRNHGWQALPYVWDDTQSEAYLSRTGEFVELSLLDERQNETRFDYLVPNVNQCANCHMTDTRVGLQPIGPKARHLNTSFAYFDGTANQLQTWADMNILTGLPDLDSIPAAYEWTSKQTIPSSWGELDAAARAYIDINCAHCHSRTGQADTSGLYLEPWEPVSANFGVCKTPIAAGRGTGERLYGIAPGQSDQSILVYRMASTRADVMMPELGRATADNQGVALIAQWIDQMEGSCS